MRADVVPESLNEEARTVDVVWTTGARVKRFDWFDGPFWEELDTSPKSVRMERLKSGRAPVFLQHNSYNPNAHQGVVVKASIKGGEGTATLRFLTGDADADKTWNKIRQGVLTSVSVGYNIHRVEETKGTDGTLPVRRAVDWEPYEISPVAMPADPGAHIRSDVRTTNPCEFITRGEAPQKETKMADETNPPAPAPANPTPDADHLRAVAAERERTVAITTLARRHGMSPEMTDKLISEGSTLDAARAAILNEMVTRSDAQPIQGYHRIEAGDDARDKFQRGAARSGRGWCSSAAGGNRWLPGRRWKRRWPSPAGSPRP
jgi:HK97 family phage prohead protease